MHKTGQLLSWDLLSDSRGYRLCTLQDLCTESFVTDMRVHLDDPVKVVRKQWEEMTGVSWKNIMVYYEGKLIRAKTTFRDIGLKYGDDIFMVGKTVFTKIGTV